MTTPVEKIQCKINDLILDVVVTESTDTSWDLTQYKIQSGFSATDARIKGRIKLNLDCVFVDEELETWKDKHAKLKDLADKEDVVTVVLGISTFSDMSIKNIGTVRDEKRAGYLSFSIAFEELPVVNIDFEEVDTSLMPKDPAPETKKETKKKSTKADKKNTEPKSAAEPERASTAYGMAY